MASRLVIPPKPTKTKRCAVAVFRVVRGVAHHFKSNAVRVPKYIRQTKVDIASAWQETKGRAR